MAMPLARDVVKDIAIEHGGCIRPVQLRRTDLATGQTEQILVPCGHTLASVCPACAERAANLRAAQCREGWHLDHEPDLELNRAGMRGKVASVRPRRQRSTRRRQDAPPLPRRKIDPRTVGKTYTAP